MITNRNVIVLLISMLCSISYSQLNISEDGLYYDENNELYSGNYIEFHSNGNKRIELNLKDGLKDGEVHIFFENGTLNEIRTYKAGVMHGTWTMWNNIGIKIGVANYQDNLKHGEWFIWDENGQMRFSMFYNKGEKSGTWKMWNENGELISEAKY